MLKNLKISNLEDEIKCLKIQAVKEKKTSKHRNIKNLLTEKNV